MKNFNKHKSIHELVSWYEEMRQNGNSHQLEPRAYLDIANFYKSEYMSEEALSVVNDGIEKYKSLAELHIKRAQLLIDLKKEDIAMDSLDKAESLDPMNINIYLLKSDIYASLDLHEEAFKILDIQLPKANDFEQSEICLRKAVVYHKLGEYGLMFEYLKDSLRKNPNNRGALERMWIAAELSKNQEDSLSIHNAILDKNPFSYFAWYNRGQALSYLGEYEEAVESFEYAFLLNENFEFAYKDCAEFSYLIHDYQKALSCYEEILERFDEDVEIYNNIGHCYLKLDKRDKAKEHFKKSLEIDPICDDSLYLLGRCSFLDGDLDTAIDYYKEALTIEEYREEYIASLGDAYYKKGEMRKAEFCYRKAADISAESSEYWIKLITFLLNSGKVKNALKTVEEALKNSFGYELNFYKIISLYLLGKKSEALSNLAESLEEEYKHHQYLFEIAPGLKDEPEIQALINALKPV